MPESPHFNEGKELFKAEPSTGKEHVQVLVTDEVISGTVTTQIVTTCPDTGKSSRAPYSITTGLVGSIRGSETNLLPPTNVDSFSSLPKPVQESQRQQENKIDIKVSHDKRK